VARQLLSTKLDRDVGQELVIEKAVSMLVCAKTPTAQDPYLRSPLAAVLPVAMVDSSTEKASEYSLVREVMKVSECWKAKLSWYLYDKLTRTRQYKQKAV
jgi:hypothetical protein